jgi:ABC-2 type transport system ATP-binding protein
VTTQQPQTAPIAAADASVRLDNVSFRYRSRAALAGVTVASDPRVTGLVGPNGAGKTTLLSLAATVLPPQTGQVTVAGHDVSTREGRAAARAALGLLPQRFDLSGAMRVVDTVAYAAWAHGVSTADCFAYAMRALEIVELTDLARDRVRRLSGGQRQRLGIAAATAHQPRVLLLDEPTVGLDPSQRIRVRRHLDVLGRDRCVVISTHMIEDVAHLCERVVVLNHGKVLFDGNAERLAAHPGAAGADHRFASPLSAPTKR